VAKTGFKFGNIIGQINTAKNLIQSFGDETSEGAAKTGVEIHDALEAAGRVAARGAVPFGQQITNALDTAFGLVNDKLAEKTREFRSAQLGATARGGGQQAGLEEVFNRIVSAGGSSQQQIANLRRQAEVQAKIIDAAGPDAAGVLLERRRAAQAQLAQINQQITSIENQVTADQKSAAADQQRAADERQRIREAQKRARDQEFLQIQEDARTGQERLITQAGDTPRLTDDIRQQEQLRALIQKQIAGIKASALDEDAKQQALRDLRKARDATTDEIKRLVATDKQQREAQRQQTAEALADARLELAQTTFDLTGAKAPLERALDAEIKRQIRIKNAAKKGSVAFLQAQNEIRRLLKQKKDLNEEVKADAAGTTDSTSVFELLKQNAETFNQTGGNLVTGNQPFAGPTGFTADIAQFLHRPPQVQMVAPKTDVNVPLISSNAELIRVIQENTDAIRGTTGGNDQASVGTGFSGAGKWWARSFYASRVARQLTEAG
jgi:hypothetical protein